MTKTFVSRIVALACAGAFLVAALTGCMQQSSAASEEQTANRQYMAQVNQKMDSLGGKLEGFNDAVSRGDVVGMRTQADAAFKVIDELSAIEAPEVLGDIHAGYVEGCELLEQARSEYVALYAEVEGVSGNQPFDRSAYDSRLAGIQDLYDRGIAKLEETDLKASEL